MDRVIYTAMTGASQTLNQQAITSNNLANVTTPGFRAQLATMKAVPVEGATLPTRTMVAATTPLFDSSVGPLNYTGRDLDIALADDHWLAVQMPNGEEAYTRNGSIQVDENGDLKVRGLPLIGDSGELNVPQGATVSIGSDGTISALSPGNAPKTIAQVGRIKKVYIERTDLQRGDDGLFHLTAQAKTQLGNQLEDNPESRLMSGVLEGSNVNPVAAMVDLISNSRKFEMQMKNISTADENAQKANQILSLS